MTHKHTNAIEELDPNELVGYSEAQKSYYLSLGFKPYRMASGHVKWLSPALHANRINGVPAKPILKKIFGARNTPKVFTRKHTPQFIKFLRAHLAFILIFVTLIVVLIFLFSHPQILIRG